MVNEAPTSCAKCGREDESASPLAMRASLSNSAAMIVSLHISLNTRLTARSVLRNHTTKSCSKCHQKETTSRNRIQGAAKYVWHAVGRQYVPVAHMSTKNMTIPLALFVETVSCVPNSS